MMKKKQWIWTGLLCAALGVGFALWLAPDRERITEPLPISDELKSTLEPMPEPEPIDLEGIER